MIVLGLSSFVAYILNTVTACLKVFATSKAGVSSGIVRDSGSRRTMYNMAATNMSVTYLENIDVHQWNVHIRRVEINTNILQTKI